MFYKHASACLNSLLKKSRCKLIDIISSKTPHFLFLDDIIFRQASNCCLPKNVCGISLVQDLLVTMFRELMFVIVNNKLTMKENQIVFQVASKHITPILINNYLGITLLFSAGLLHWVFYYAKHWSKQDLESGTTWFDAPMYIFLSYNSPPRFH